MTVSLDPAFTLAAAELGMATSAWLFAQEVHGVQGDDGVSLLRDQLGRKWPVLDAICAAWLEGARPPGIDAQPLVDRLHGFRRLLIVGLEARWLDPLLAGLPASLRLGLLQHSELLPDWQRVASNLPSRVEFVDLAHFQTWAGSSSALLSFVYGCSNTSQDELFTTTSWARVSGPDVRTQFRELLAWDVLEVPLKLYPRWLVAVSPDTFTWIHP